MTSSTIPGPGNLGRSAPVILLVDDSEGIRALISEIMGQAGYPVTAFPDGDSALLFARDHPPDLVITDLSMPGRPVHEMIRSLRQDFPGVRVIILSALLDDLMCRSIMSSGVDAAIDKGSVPELLLETVSRVLGAAQSIKNRD